MLRVFALLAVLVFVLATGWRLARTDAGEPDAAPRQPAGYWLGPSFAGLAVDESAGATFYGTCEIPPGQDEGGCAPPLEVQTDSACQRNPVAIDRTSTRVSRVRGGAIAVDYGDMIDVGIAASTVTIFADDPSIAHAAPRELRRRSESVAPSRYAAPRYPRAALAELKRVVVARSRLRTSRRIGRELGLSASAVATRLRVADLLPRRVLRRVPVPQLSFRQIQRNRQAAFKAEEFGEQSVARELRITRDELRRRIRSVRGLTGHC